MTSDEAWADDVGSRWKLLIFLLAAGCAVAGWTAALYDSDLPMHLATGEWILREGRVPFVEPFAWTRQGDPFFAYSWLAEVAYYWLLREFGANGLHALHALLSSAAFLSVYWLGRVARWSPWSTLLAALLSFAMWTSFIAAVRPQSVMAVTVPMSWVAAELLVQKRTRAGAIATFAAAVLTANTHLLFPVTAVAGTRLLAEQNINWRAVAVFTAANLLGWLATPYALVLPELLRMNLTDNPLAGRTTSISELEPGFRALTHAAFSLQIAALVLLLLPVFIAGNAMTRRERIWYGLAWTGGLVLFSLALRGLVIWLLVSLPLVARAVAALPVPQLQMNRRITALATLIIPVALAGAHYRAASEVASVTATADTRQLPVMSAAMVEPHVRWLECNTSSSARIKTFTVFNYGSYLTWRAPFASYSIDGRGIFPDSVARPEVFQLAADGPMLTGPWRTADVAIVPVRHAVSVQIDADSAWTRVLTNIPADTTLRTSALWVRNAWAAVAVSPLAPSGDTVRQPNVIEPPGPCRQ